MTELRMFYRMLGIAENIIEPSFYHLLAIDRKDCDLGTVRAALLARKNELRQNAPGPEFVPQIIEFEKEYLDPAALVLSDDVKRAKYDTVISKRWHRVKHEANKRSHLVGAVRLAITNAIDAQGALSTHGKEALGDELKFLGVEEHNVGAILTRIPAPLFETGEHDAINVEFFAGSVELAADDGGLDECAKTKLFALAERLNIDKDKAGAAIDGAMVKGDFLIEKAYLDEDEDLQSEADLEAVDGSSEIADAGDAAKIQLVEDVLDDEHEQGEEVVVDDEDSEAETAYATMQNRWRKEEDNSGNAFKYIAIVVGLIVFGAVAYFMMSRGDVGGEGDVTDGIKGSDGSHDQPGGVDGDGGEVTVEGVDEGTDDGTNNGMDDLGDVDDGYDIDDPDDSSDDSDAEDRQVSAELSDAAKFLVIKDFTELPMEELLSDTVVAMAASCDRASIFAWQSHLWNAELNEMLAGPKVSDVIVSRVVFADADADAEVEDSLDDGIYEQYKKDISSSDKHVRYYAVERLKNDGSRRAVEVLLGEPGSGLSGSKQIISRRLRGLRQINKPYIAGELADRIAVCSRAGTAQYISLALVDMTGITPTGSGALAAKNEVRDREACSVWWKRALKDWQGEVAAVEQPLVDEQLAGEISRPGRLVAAAAYYCMGVAGELAVFGSPHLSGSERQRPASGAMGKITAGLDGDVVFVEAAARVNERLENALRKLDRDKSYADKIDVVMLAGYQGKFAAVTGFQETAASIETSGRLLEILVSLSYPDGRFDVEIEKIRSDREADIQRTRNVLQEIRQHALYNLRLFDLLLQEIDSADVITDTDLDSTTTNDVAGDPNMVDVAGGDDSLKLRKERRLAFGDLAVGLEAYLAGRVDVAGEHLVKSLGYGDGEYVRGLFHSEYSALLDDIIAKCQVAKGHVCQACGGTEIVDCGTCYGIGWNLCRECRGTGQITDANRLRDERVRGSSRAGSSMCTFCGGLTVVKCKKCQGKGLVACDEDGDGSSVEDAKSASGPAKDDVKRMLAIALYLKKGGADIYSETVLRGTGNSGTGNSN